MALSSSASHDFPWLDHLRSDALRHMARHHPDRYGALLPKRIAEEKKIDAEAANNKTKDIPVDGSMALLNITSLSLNEMQSGIRQMYRREPHTPYGGRDPAGLRNWGSDLNYASHAQSQSRHESAALATAAIYPHHHKAHQNPQQGIPPHLAAFYAARTRRHPSGLYQAAV